MLFFIHKNYSLILQLTITCCNFKYMPLEPFKLTQEILKTVQEAKLLFRVQQEMTVAPLIFSNSKRWLPITRSLQCHMPIPI